MRALGIPRRGLCPCRLQERLNEPAGRIRDCQARKEPSASDVNVLARCVKPCPEQARTNHHDSNFQLRHYVYPQFSPNPSLNSLSDLSSCSLSLSFPLKSYQLIAGRVHVQHVYPNLYRFVTYISVNYS